METPEQPAIDFYRPKKYPEELFDGKYTLVQHRLEGGAVYRGEQRYLRIGPKASTVDEEINE